MKKKTALLKVIATLALTVIFIFCAAFAVPSSAEALSNNAKNKDIVRINYVHYVSNGQAATKMDAGYKLMGVKWKTSPVSYSINTGSIPSGLNATDVQNAFASSSETWDASTSKELFNLPSVTTAHYGALDGQNTVEFGLYSGNSSVIAVTSVWYNRRTKAIVEFDMLYNTYYAWGNADTTTSTVMDLQNIATHELGHAVGLSDIYSGTYSYVTMYGYAGFNETAKRSLEQPDITGLQVLYGR